MDVIESLLSNPIAILVLIGILANIFKRKKEADAESTNTKLNNQLKQRAESYVEVKQQQREGEHPPPTTRTSIEPNFEDRHHDVIHTEIPVKLSSKIDDVSLTAIGNTNQIRKHHKHRKKHTSKDKIALSSISRKKVIEGVIWSEIMGAPRAKKPYRPKQM